MGSVSNIPLKTTELYLLCLIPEDRSGLLMHHLNQDSRLLLTVHETKGLMHQEYQAFEEGGILTSVEDDEQNAPDKILVAKATRIVKTEFETWDKLKPSDRIRVQIAWALESLRHAENDLFHAINLPFVDARETGSCSWDILSLMAILDRIQHAVSVLDGMHAVLESI